MRRQGTGGNILIIANDFSDGITVAEITSSIIYIVAAAEANVS